MSSSRSSGVRSRVRAPALTGRGWLNTGGAHLRLDQLRGRIVVLDFWTSCCVNCLHVLAELRPLEDAYADVLVIIGVHSPKFSYEAEVVAVQAAVDRYGVRHPVLDDPELSTWSAYAARAWPTLVVIDPQGYVVATMSGEGHAHGLGVLLDELVAEHEVKGTLRRGDGPYVAPDTAGSALRFPARALALPDGGFLIADTAHHQLVELGPDLLTERRRIGSGSPGFADGAAQHAQFAEPQGFAVLPVEVAAAVGWDLVVADSANHALRGIRLADGAVRTVAGTGQQLRRREGGGAALRQDLSTPFDVCWFDGQVVIAMAGVHQLWAFDPVREIVRVMAGTTAEGLQDGPAELAWFAQPSGFAVQREADGETLWFVDAETSALRWLRRNGTASEGVPLVRDDRMANVEAIAASGYQVGTVVGQGLFDFGFRDGFGNPGDGQPPALLQHPLGLALTPDGSVLVADTYNGAVRRVELSRQGSRLTAQVSTLLRELAEPCDVLVDDGSLIVVESAAHRVSRFVIPAALQMDAGAHTVTRPVTELSPGPVELRVTFVPPTGQKLDDRFGEATRLVLAASPPELLRTGGGEEPGLRRQLRLADPDVTGVAEGVLHVSVQAAACDESDQEFAACHLYQQDWGVPIRLVTGADAELVLDLRGRR